MKWLIYFLIILYANSSINQIKICNLTKSKESSLHHLEKPGASERTCNSSMVVNTGTKNEGIYILLYFVKISKHASTMQPCRYCVVTNLSRIPIYKQYCFKINHI